ncbi:hypothetical protein [Rhodoglobus aureus]|uniref:Uncharacterized protein n=1 Tax=Rhodoglobus aureus TaxID=191497 RepID=A0ABN1VWX0_9MICO
MNAGDRIWSIAVNVWEWVGAQQSVIVALAAVVTAAIAIFALRSTANDSRERSRPIVLAYFRLSPHNDSAFDLVVRNFGTSAASDIVVKSDPPFGPTESNDRMVNALEERYEKPVPLLPPGSEITNVWWALDFTAPNKSGKNRYSTPDEAVMTITYKGNRFRRYKGRIKLDTNWMKGSTSTVSSDSRPGLEKQNTEALKKIAAEVRSARMHLRDITDVMEKPDETESVAPRDAETLLSLIGAIGSDMTALATRLGVSEAQAAAIAELVDLTPETDEIKIVSSGQITPGASEAS